ncbi:MAG TPA: cytochrome b N-terminal domain-containing protein [Gemmatimonadales bacterium]
MPERIIKASKELRRRATDLRDDIRESADSNLLGILRFLGLLYGPIDRHARIDQALRTSLKYRLAPHVGWRHALGGITYLLLMILVATGVLMAFYYRPSAQEAYSSIQHIVTRVPFGWLIRDLHSWAASAVIVVVLAHMARTFFQSTYKPPREMNWFIGVLLLVVLLAFGATGYLLPWDQWAYWTVTELLTVVPRIPLVGGLLAELVTGDVIVSGATLSRHFAIHVIILPWILFALVGLHFALVRKHGVTPPAGPVDRDGPGIPFFPHHLLRSVVVAVFVVGVLVSLAVLFPRPFSAAANPQAPPADMVSSWVIVDVSRAVLRYLGVWGFALFALIGFVLAALPFWDREPAAGMRSRPLVAAIGLVFFLGIVGAWAAGRTLQSEPPAASVAPAAVPAAAADGLPLESPGLSPPRLDAPPEGSVPDPGGG